MKSIQWLNKSEHNNQKTVKVVAVLKRSIRMIRPLGEWECARSLLRRRRGGRGGSYARPLRKEIRQHTRTSCEHHSLLTEQTVIPNFAICSGCVEQIAGQDPEITLLLRYHKANVNSFRVMYVKSVLYLLVHNSKSMTGLFLHFSGV